MDEIKTANQGGQNQQGEGGRKRRRKRHRGGGNGSKQNGQNQPVQNQNGQKPQQPQNTQKQNGGNNGKQNRNKGDNGAKQKPQNQNKSQPQQHQKQQQKQTQGAKQNQNNQGNKKDTYLYVLDGNLYVNLTNKCSNGCDFCVRNERDSYYGYYLWLKNGDPTVEKVIAAANAMDLSQYKEAVFCGFGEPTYKVNEMVQLCDFFHAKGLSTRLNTNGQGNLINKRDIVPDLKDKIDLVNISLNFSCAEKYQPVCRSQFGLSGFEAILEFARQCKRNEINCRFSIVDCIGEEEVEACKRLAESLHVPLYIRDYITDS